MKLKIDKGLLPIKLHYFFFFAALGPILPQLNVFGRQLGVSAAAMGLVTAVLPLLWAVAKPAFGYVVDYFTNQRKLIFMLLIITMTGCYSALWFLPMPRDIQTHYFNNTVYLRLLDSNSNYSGDLIKLNCNSTDIRYNIQLYVPNTKYISTIYVDKKEQITCNATSMEFDSVREDETVCVPKKNTYLKCVIDKNEKTEDFLNNVAQSNNITSQNATMNNNNKEIIKINETITQPTEGNTYKKKEVFTKEIEIKYSKEDDDLSLYISVTFWLFVVLMSVGTVAFNVANCIGDAVCFDVLGADRGSKYGSQRAWGTVGYGVTALLGGFLIDSYSRGQEYKDFTPAFIIALVATALDLYSCRALKESVVEVWRERRSPVSGDGAGSVVSEDGSDDECRSRLDNATSPLSSPVRDRSPIREERPAFSIVVEQGAFRGPRQGRAGARRGRGRAGRGRGRACLGRGGGRRGDRGGSTWGRGEPLVQVLISDEELPEELRSEINTYIAGRERRGKGAGDETDEEADQYFDAEEFVWKPMDGPTNTSNKETFRVERPGPTRHFANAYDAFRGYWDDAILSHIATETNEYAQGIQSPRFLQDWKKTSPEEILKLFCFWMMLGVIRMPSINSCFSSNPLLKTEIFRCLFKRERYWILNRAFHLARGHVDPDNEQNVLYPIEHVLAHANTKFQEMYVLHQEISIDESLTLWKGPCEFKQYIKTKSAKYGIKTQQLCESSTGYLWAFFVYIGARTSNSSLPSSSSTVLRLMRPLQNLGHTLYMDNWFNSPRLARHLKRQGTDCVGTLRANQQEVPPVIQKAPLVEGEFVARSSGDVRVVALQDRKRLQLISTCHDLSQVRKEARPGHPAQYKLQLVDDYNHGMGGIDKMEQMLEPYLVERKQCRKWSKKLFKRILNASIQNARILVEASTNTKIDSLVFRLTLVQSILERHGFAPSAVVPSGSSSFQNALNLELRGGALPSHNFPPSRLITRCFISKIPIPEPTAQKESGSSRGNTGRRQCVLCSYLRKRKSVRYECLTCGVALCLEDCFQAFHTVPLV